MPRESCYWRTEPVISPCEIAVMRLAAQGFENKQIATLRGVQLCTIKHQISSVLRKLDALDRTHAVAICIKEGLI